MAIPETRITLTPFTDAEVIDEARLAIDSVAVKNHTKIAARRKLLCEQPYLRIWVDEERLRAIIPYELFYCHPTCSIARKEAIVGSDIDKGLVVVPEGTTIDQECAFVRELRSQGFNTYHQVEYEAAYARWRENPDGAPIFEGLERIHFATRAALQKMKSEAMATRKTGNWQLLIYLAGYPVTG